MPNCLNQVNFQALLIVACAHGVLTFLMFLMFIVSLILDVANVRYERLIGLPKKANVLPITNEMILSGVRGPDEPYKRRGTGAHKSFPVFATTGCTVLLPSRVFVTDPLVNCGRLSTHDGRLPARHG